MYVVQGGKTRQAREDQGKVVLGQALKMMMRNRGGWQPFPAAFQWQAIAIAMKASLLSAAHVAFSTPLPSKLPASLRFVFTLPNR
jgi:hypothetical protein